MKPRIDQAVAGMHPGDAITSDALGIRDALLAAGFESDILCDPTHLNPKMRGEACDYQAWRGKRGDVVIYHFSIDSPLTDWWLGLAARRMIRYHNITPAIFFHGVNEVIAAQLARGRETLPQLADAAEHILCVSGFNAEDFHALGCDRTSVVPIVMNMDGFDGEPDTNLLRELESDPRPQVLFVGRLVPNKCQADLVRVQAVRQSLGMREVKINIVGSWGSSQRYHNAVASLRSNLRCVESVQLWGHVTHGELMAHWKAADLFLCLSEHEGFCVPVVEAMHHRVPVIAYAAGGVPETLGDSGILVTKKHFAAIAEMMDVVLDDETLREKLRQRQAERLKVFSPEAAKRRLVETLQGLIGAAV